MRIQVGSRVKFLNDVGGGIVRGFAQDKMALVETDDGFEIPVLVTDLLLDTGGGYGMDDEASSRETVAATPPKAVVVEEPVSYRDKQYQPFKGECLMAVVPQNDQLLHVSNFDLYLINDSNYHFSYVVTYSDGSHSSLVATGSVDPDTKLEIAEYNQTSISKVKAFRLQGVFYKPGWGDTVATLTMEFTLEGISFYKQHSFRENEYFHSKAILSKATRDEMQEAMEKLKDSDLGTIVREKEQKTAPKQAKPAVNATIEEVDLHIEQLVENHSGMSNGEIVNTQMARFEVALETALNSKVQRIVFIHGVGSGSLKHELRKKLDRKYSHLRYQDASFKEYGYGATMVYLK